MLTQLTGDFSSLTLTLSSLLRLLLCFSMYVEMQAVKKPSDEPIASNLCSACSLSRMTRPSSPFAIRLRVFRTFAVYKENDVRTI